MKKLIIILCIFSYSSAFSFSDTDGWGWNAGLFQHNIFNLTDTADSKASALGDFYFPLGIEYGFNAFNTWSFTPSFHITHITNILLNKETQDDAAEKNFYLLNLPFSKLLTDKLAWKLGLGIFQFELKGNGGTTTLNNGTSTSTFYLPNDTRKSTNGFVLLGGYYKFQNFRLDTDLQIHTAFSEERRSYSLYIYTAWKFGDGIYY